MSWNNVDGEIPIPVWDGETLVGLKPGYHLNMPLDLITPTIAAYVITPTPVTPERVYAGDPDAEGNYVLTAFLRFADQAEAITILADYWFPDDV